uniref:Endo-1,4-beta-glucanase n=1 Tax=Corbicula japonica TaxID=141464 RepID=B9X0W0_9BIVA|nr:endo-1,4-beta-glucanase [Corbicula japonica]
MKVAAAVLLALVGLVCVDANQKCSGNPLSYQGKRCASTTWYADYHKGACGCGPDNNDNQFDWNHSKFVAAASQHLFDPGLKTWCGAQCGKCVKLTTTGGFVDGQGSHVAEGQSHVFMITNLCPNEWPNLSWCSQSSQSGYKNHYGYSEHFDLEDGAGQVAAIGWKGKNPEVTWEYVNCDQAHSADSRTPGTRTEYSQCFCSKHPDGGK